MKSNPSFSWVRAFEAAARLQSFTLAAAELNLTPSAISHQIKSLENHFSKPFFIRHNRQVVLNTAGMKFYKELHPILSQLSQLYHNTSNHSTKNILHVHCAPSLAVKWLSPRMVNFLQLYPDITIQLTTDATPPNLAKPSDIDIAICYGTAPKVTQNIITEPLEKELILSLCSPSLLSRLSSQDKWYLSLPLINSTLSPISWNHWFGINQIQASLNPRLSFDRGAMAVAAATDGLGVALETFRFAEKEINSGQLIVLETPNSLPLKREMHFLYYRNTTEKINKTHIFKEWLLNQ